MKNRSITLNGVAGVCEDGSPDEAMYRALHLDNNLDYKQFIVGSKDIAVITVELGVAAAVPHVACAKPCCVCVREGAHLRHQRPRVVLELHTRLFQH